MVQKGISVLHSARSMHKYIHDPFVPLLQGETKRRVCLISSRWTSGYKHRVDTYFNTCYSATTVAYQVSTLTGAYIHTYYIVINRELIQ
jgi:hypothetical protein